MNVYKTISFLCSLLICASINAGQVSVQMPRSQGYVGVPMQLIVVFENTEPDIDPSIPELDGFSIRKLPNIQTSSHTTIINGRMTSTSSQAVTFLLTPKRVGTFTIPALTFGADGKLYQSKPKKLEIQEPPTGGALRAEIVGTSGDIYLGQPINLTLNIFLEQFEDGELDVSLDAKDMFSRIRTDSEFGLFTDNVTSGQVKAQQINGLNDAGLPTTFFVFSVQATAWPETTGSFELTPIHILVDYPISLEQTRGFGFFGGDTLRVDQSQLISAQAELPMINVLSPPALDQPPWYSGAIGTFDFRMVAEPTYVNVGEPITITMRVSDLTSGPVNLDYLSAPNLGQVEALTNNFRVPDVSLGGLAEGRTKTFTQSIRPKHDDVVEIPPIPFSFYNPTTNSYETRWSKAIPITVYPTETISAQDLFGTTSHSNQNDKKESFTEVEGGILANYDDNSLLEDQTIQTTPILIASIATPPAFFFGFACTLFYRKRNQRVTIRKSHALKHAVKELRKIRNPDSISQILRELQRQFEFNQQQIGQLNALIHRCDLMQYGGEQDESLSNDAVRIVEVLQ